VGTLQTLLDVNQEVDAQSQVQIEALGQELNTALARVAQEERRRRELEEAEADRLAEEAARLAAEAQDLESYRSEFFGRCGRRSRARGRGGGGRPLRLLLGGAVPAGERAAFARRGRRRSRGVADLLQEIAGEVPPGIDWVIQVDGHTDSTPLSGAGRFRDNWELSQARALSVLRQLSEVEGIPADRLSANGFGEFQPWTSAARPRARRATGASRSS
jgi:chemotaxis protein MotB